MVGDKIQVKPHHMAPAKKIETHLSQQIGNADSVFCINISGESGSGKSTLAVALQMILEEKGIKTAVIHMDDYFVLPPASNHNNRLISLDNVGPHEVNLSLLQRNIEALKSGNFMITQPLVHYEENRIENISKDYQGVKVIIIEGTYTSLLENVDCKVFIDRNFKDTYQQREERAREPMTPFIESVLQLEHQIISAHKSLADIVVDVNYEVHFT